ncbi:MAG TPA: hypothetical protein PKD64_02340 [Pirellulaceae bacterium]|nr:hypothetical protein [Pirellulaceae bacterium]HMO91007.1 hypothetical protein [Pirellulaceae bacterium]HMP68122.1 hypothetical protein [Pirellulaceae bacterium]
MQSSIKFDNIEWRQLNEFAEEKRVTLGETSMRLLRLAPGFEEVDWCTRGHVGYVIEGVLLIQFDQHTETYTSGDGLHIDYGVPHRALKLKQKTVLFIVDEN